jgi:hypothetical protein
VQWNRDLGCFVVRGNTAQRFSAEDGKPASTDTLDELVPREVRTDDTAITIMR